MAMNIVSKLHIFIASTPLQDPPLLRFFKVSFYLVAMASPNLGNKGMACGEGLTVTGSQERVYDLLFLCEATKVATILIGKIVAWSHLYLQ